MWQLYEPLVELPTVDQVFDEAAGASFTQTDEIIVERGDLLYVPRGIPHRPATLDTHSVHVTLVLFAPSWIEVLQRALTAGGADDLFRRAPRQEEDWSPAVQQALFRKLEAIVSETVPPPSDRPRG